MGRLVPLYLEDVKKPVTDFPIIECNRWTVIIYASFMYITIFNGFFKEVQTSVPVGERFTVHFYVLVSDLV